MFIRMRQASFQSKNGYSKIPYRLNIYAVLCSLERDRNHYLANRFRELISHNGILMKHLLRLAFAMWLLGSAVMAQSLSPYYTQMDFQLASSGAIGSGLYGFENPALLNYVRQPDLIFAWNTNPSQWKGMDKWGLFTAVPHLGFGMIRQDIHHPELVGFGYGSEKTTITDYRLALGVGSRSFGLGLGYGWSGRNAHDFPVYRENVFTVGTLLRPNRYLSLGMTGYFVEGSDQGLIDAAVRPLGSEKLTLFGDYVVQKKGTVPDFDNNWSAGVATEFLPGVRVVARYFESKAATVGFQFSLGRAGLSAQTHMDKNQNHSATTYAVRIGAYDRNIFRSHLQTGSAYVRMDWKNTISYRRYILFDRSLTFSKLLDQIDAARYDPAVAGLAINLSGIDVDREMAWELREKLKEFRTTGKHVVVFIDRGGMTEYHLASVADRIVMDPAGTLVLNGYVMGRTFLKGTLEKLGIAFDEWRYFKYKSADENLSRDAMSEGDREQRQALLDDLYDVVKSDICASRPIVPDRFDALINDSLFFLPAYALENGLIDVIGRWDSVEAVIKTLEGRKTGFMKPRALERYHLPYDAVWGERPRIAVIYAIGVCDMDEGIAARRLVKDVERATRDSRIKAVVFRVDSPGGDALPSDIVAEALKKCREKKPVIVSQGYVAASGGYWLSMYADTIVAAPFTITGSIGVIGGWLYNAGLKEKLGMTTDLVKVGRHGDLGFGFRAPLVGLGLPDRNMDETERAKAGRIIQDMYSEFVTKVAASRKRTYDDIHAVGQGRVWSGVDGRERGLVDVLGGLETAIGVARIKAGLGADADIQIVEMPKPDLMNPGAFLPRFFDMGVARDPVYDYLKFRARHNGMIMPILPMDDTELQTK